MWIVAFSSEKVCYFQSIKLCVYKYFVVCPAWLGTVMTSPAQWRWGHEWMLDGYWNANCRTLSIMMERGYSQHSRHPCSSWNLSQTQLLKGFRSRDWILNGKINDQILLIFYLISFLFTISLCLEKWEMIATALSILSNKLMLAWLRKGISSKSCLTRHSAPGEWVRNEWAHILLQTLQRKMILDKSCVLLVQCNEY